MGFAREGVEEHALGGVDPVPGGGGAGVGGLGVRGAGVGGYGGGGEIGAGDGGDDAGGGERALLEESRRWRLGG